MKKRTALLLAAALLILLTACGGASDAEPKDTPAAGQPADASRPGQSTPVTLDVGLLGNSVKPVGVLVADSLGYFDEEGVDIHFEKVSSMNDAYTAVSTGDLDVYLFSSTAAATFISQGVTTLRVFGGTAGEGGEMMSAAGRGITLDSADDFKGLTIACQMPETSQMVLKDYLLKQGLTIGGPDSGADVSFVFVNDSNAAIIGCVNGEYDLCITNSCMGYYAADFGAELVGTVSDFVKPYPCCRQTCHSDTYVNEFDALVKFETAALRGYAYAREHEEETLDILEAYSGEERDFLRAQVYGTDAYTPDMRLSLDPDKDACVAFYQAMENIGQIEPATEIDWSEYVVSDVYGSALEILSEREPDTALWGELTAYFKEHNS